MNNKYYHYNFDIIISGASQKQHIDKLLPGILKQLDARFENYLYQIEYDTQQQFFLTICCHTKNKTTEKHLLDDLKTTISNLDMRVHPRKGHHAFLHGCNQMKTRKQKCYGPYAKGEGEATQIDTFVTEESKLLWNHIQRHSDRIKWIRNVSIADKNNLFIIQALKQNLFLHIIFVGIKELIDDVCAKPPHSLYIIDFRSWKEPLLINAKNSKQKDKFENEQFGLYTNIKHALDTIATGRMRTRIQSPANVVCFSDLWPNNSNDYTCIDIENQVVLQRQQQKTITDSKE